MLRATALRVSPDPLLARPLREPMTDASRDRHEKQAGFKPRDVEEVVDFYFHRPLASWLVRLLLPLPVTPDQVTFGSAAVGLLSGGVIAVAVWRSAWWVAPTWSRLRQMDTCPRSAKPASLQGSRWR